VLARPKGLREQIATKRIRVSDRTLARLKKLQKSLRLQTLDETIYYYLPPPVNQQTTKPRPVKELMIFLKRPSDNKLISNVSKELNDYINKLNNKSRKQQRQGQLQRLSQQSSNMAE
jgi:hypothetical protein